MVDLDEAHGIDVGVAQADGPAQHGVVLQDLARAGDGEDAALGAVPFREHRAQDPVAQAAGGWPSPA